jgi:dipeptidyl aminopeptidase/acylaminoacyl peptidase
LNTRYEGRLVATKAQHDSYSPQQDWKKSGHAALIEQFGTHPSILKIRGRSNRSDFLYLSDEPGYFTIYRWDPNAQEGTKVLLDEEPVTDSAATSDFVLHPCEPWIVYSKSREGERDHSLYLLNYETREMKELVHAIGIVEFLISYNAEVLIAVVTTRENVQLLTISYEGELAELLTTEQQVLSIAASALHEVVAIAVGRGTTEIVILNPENGTDTRRISETEASKEGCLTIEEEAGYLAYTTNAKGDSEELVIRSLETFEEIKRIAVPGSIGFFDLSYLEWVNDHELLAAVAQDGRVSPLLLNITDAAWSAPLAETSAIYLTKTTQGIVWVASDFARPEFVQAYRDGQVETVIPPTFENKALVVENHWYPSFDGRQIQGWLMRNAEHPKAPLIVMCHGGPTTAVKNEWGEPIVQLLVQAGYHVFQPNFRGSTTFGTEFMSLQIGDVGGGDLQDVLYGANHISELLELDTQPIIMGVSYGGYLTLQALTTQPDNWAGGVAIVPFSDWIALYNSADAHYRKYCEHLLSGTPEGQPELYKERSPITYLARLTKPVLILTGDDDSGYADVKAFYDTAKSMAKPVYLVVQKTGHGTSTADQMNAEIVHSLDFLHTLR